MRAGTVLITGASSGIGQATALYLAEKGYSVIGTSRSIARLANLETKASERGVPLRAVEMALNSAKGVDHVMRSLIGEFGNIDVLVNNAGYGLWGPIECLSMAEISAQFETNFFAVVRLIKHVLPE